MIYDKFTDTEAIRPISRAVVSPAIEVKIGSVIIGYIQEIREVQNYDSNEQYEVGTVGVVELIPTQPNYQLTIRKLGVYHYNAVKVLAQKGIETDTRYDAIKTLLAAKNHSDQDMFTSLVHVPIPFDIVVKELDPNEDPTDPAVMATTYKDCRITSYTRPIVASGNLTVAEDAMVKVRDIKYARIS